MTCSSLASHGRKTSEINPVWEEERTMKGLGLPKDQLFLPLELQKAVPTHIHEEGNQPKNIHATGGML